MQKYRLIAKIGEGTFSEVLKAQSIKTSKYVAIKCMKNHFDSIDQVMNLREIQALKRLSPHQHIIRLLEVLYDEPTGRLALVFELMDRNTYETIKGRKHYLPESRVKSYMYQLLKAIDHMHRNGIFHRDIKPENLLVVDDELKLADFGSCKGIYSKQPFTVSCVLLQEYISTRWYRAPECLLTNGYYNYKMDIWGVGCVFFEILSLFPLFPGNDELDQVHKIHNVLGVPGARILDKFKRYPGQISLNFPPQEGTGIAKLIPHVSTECIDIISKMLAYDPDDRVSAREVLKSNYFRDFREQDKKVRSGSLAYSLHYPVSSVKSTGLQNSSSPKEESDELQQMSVASKKSMIPTIRNKKHAASYGESPDPVYRRNMVDNSARTMKKGSGAYSMSPSGQIMELPGKSKLGMQQLPGIKTMTIQNQGVRVSQGASDEDSESNLPPIKGSIFHQTVKGGSIKQNKKRTFYQAGTLSMPFDGKHMLKHNLSNTSLQKKMMKRSGPSPELLEDLKIDKVRLFKKTYGEQPVKRVLDKRSLKKQTYPYYY